MNEPPMINERSAYPKTGHCWIHQTIHAPANLPRTPSLVEKAAAIRFAQRIVSKEWTVRPKPLAVVEKIAKS
jgi:hypothetical protein